MLTITEALAELKTIGKRIEAKRQFVLGVLYRQDFVRDLYEQEGGTRIVVERERQAVRDLEDRSIRIREAIARANDTTTITVLGETRTIHNWLVWRREVAPAHKTFLTTMAQRIKGARDEAHKRGLQVNPASGASTPNDVIVNVDDLALAQQIERMEELLGTLDGQLSLKNATITVTVD